MAGHPERHAHYEWLDLLRLVAALLVVCGHVRGSAFREYSALAPDSRTLAVAAFFAVTRLGHEAVVVFFVLSGFLVGGKAFERMAAGSFATADYAVDRVTRIWIPLIPALVLAACIGSEPAGLKEWIGNLLGLQDVMVAPLGGNAPLWSLAYEIWFYALVYAVGRVAASRTIDLAALLVLFLFVMVFTRLQVQYLACWLVGSLLYLKPPRMQPAKSLAVSVLVSVTAVTGLQLTSAGALHLADASPGLRAGLEILLAVGAAIACASLIHLPSNRVARLAAPMAAMSYTLYLTHYPVLSFISAHGWSRYDDLDARAWAAFALLLGASLLVAWFLYLLFERQTGRARRWVKSRFRHEGGSTTARHDPSKADT